MALNNAMNDQHQLTIGIELRHDDIKDVGVGQSYRRKIYHYDSRAGVSETSLGLYTSLHSQWIPWFSSTIGGRFDLIEADVNDKLKTDSSGRYDDQLATPKVSLRFGPFSQTNIFVNYGQGFHSNDARGVAKDDNVPFLSESEGVELGITMAEIKHLQLTAVLFQLELDSELVFVGDDGGVEPKDATRRRGIELSAYYQPASWLVMDMDYTRSEARFIDDQYDGTTLLGNYVPDSIGDVFSLGASIDLDSGLYAGLRLRYFGPRYLTEAGDRESDASRTVNANAGYHFNNGISMGVEVLNLFNSRDDDITYWYESRTQAEREAGYEPRARYHSHPMIPRTVRGTIGYTF